MSCPLIIINGAAGRMGQTLVSLTGQDPELQLVGMVERAERLASLASMECAKGSSLAEVLDQVGKAVVIDFTSPESSLAVAKTVAEKGAMAVIGTTGLTIEQQAEVSRHAEKTPILWAPNMSVGVNVLLTVLPELVRKLGPAYDLEITEIHHNKKKDAPSGTAVKLGQCLAEARGWDLSKDGRFCREGIIGERPTREIGVQTVRGGDVVGDHTVYFLGPGERIEVTHRAHTRENFAQGALRAAKWLWGAKPGKLYAMADMLRG